MNNITLDFELSDEQFQALELHGRFKASSVYDDINYNLPPETAKIQVWFMIDYNDNTYDVEPIYADLIDANDKVIKKIKISAYPDIEIPDYSGGNHMQSFTISPKMLK